MHQQVSFNLIEFIEQKNPSRHNSDSAKNLHVWIENFFSEFKLFLIGRKVGVQDRHVLWE
jgi:hypothetical protein